VENPPINRNAELDHFQNAVMQSSVSFEELNGRARPAVVMVAIPATMPPKCRGWFSVLISSALQELNSSPRGRWPVQVTVDEFTIWC